jgi:hypothetical protein
VVSTDAANGEHGHNDRTMRLFALVIAAGGISIFGFAVAGHTQTTAPPDCTTVFTYRATETPLKVGPSLTVRLRNPYGRFVTARGYSEAGTRFKIVYASEADRAKVASVGWKLDGGTPPAIPDRDQYRLRELAPGPHVITAAVTLVDGSAATGEIRFTATLCEPLSFSASADNRKSRGRQPSAFNVYSGGAPLRRVQLGARGALVSTSARLRGRKVGELRFGNSKRVLSLRMPSRPSSKRVVLLRRDQLRIVLHPTARRFLEITGPGREANNLHLSFGGPRIFGDLPVEERRPEHRQTAGKPGLIGTRARCRAPLWEAWVRGETGPTVRVTSKNSRFAACLRR